MDREKVMKGLGIVSRMLNEMGRRNEMDIVDDALTLLKEQEESIPISWLEEKLEGHPELPYAVTDGITNVLYLWEGR